MPPTSFNPRSILDRITYGLSVCLILLPLLAKAQTPEPAPELAREEVMRLLTELEDGSPMSYGEQLAALKRIDSSLPPEPGTLRRRYQRVNCWINDAFYIDASVGVRYAEQALAQIPQGVDPSAELELRNCRAYFYWLNGEPDSSVTELEAIVAAARSRGDALNLAIALNTHGELLAYQGELGNALSMLLEAQQLYDHLDKPYWNHYNLSSIANAYRRMGDLEKALKYLREVEAFYLQRSAEEYLWAARAQIGLVLGDMQRPQQALAIYEGAIAFYLLSDQTDLAADQRLNAASVLNQLQQYEQALEQLALAEEHPAIGEDGANMATVALFRAQALNGLQRYQEALPHLAFAEKGIRQEQNKRFLAWMLTARAEAEEGLGQWQQAAATLREYIRNHEALDVFLSRQQTIRSRVEFDVARQVAENQKLRMEKTLQQQRLESLDERRRWQTLVTILSAILLLILAVFAYRQIQQARRLRVLALTDELTGLANRRQIMLQGNLLIDEARETQQPLSILVFDVDYFKRINDTFGHEGGDQVLRQMAPASLSALRNSDHLGRTGGEEFLAVLPNTNLSAALNVAERMRQRIEEMDLTALQPGYRVTISIGVAELHNKDLDLTSLTHRADDALYRAKDLGRNRVEASV